MRYRALLLIAVPLLLTACLPSDIPTVTDGTDSASAVYTDIYTETVPAKETAGETIRETDITAVSEVKTEPVNITGTAMLGPGTAMIYGKCEDGCVINTGGEEIRSDGENFVFSVNIPKNKTVKVTVTAKADGKAESDPVVCEVKYDKSAEDKGLFVSNGSRVVEKKVTPDIYGTNKFSDNEIKAIKLLASDRVAAARKASGKDTEIIYVIAPDPLTVYPEEIPGSMRENVKEPSARMKQAINALREIDGVFVIDPTDILISNRESGKLYYKLDSHWTELGAFYGYTALMEHIAEKFPAASPHTLEDYEVIYKEIDDTDMNVYSGVGTGEMFESAPFLEAKFTEATPYGKNKEDTARIWSFVNEYFRDVSKTVVKNKSLPSAVLLFDSYGLNMIPYTAEHFYKLAIQPVWTYGADYGLVREVKADYVIEILAERDLSSLLSSN